MATVVGVMILLRIQGGKVHDVFFFFSHVSILNEQPEIRVHQIARFIFESLAVLRTVETLCVHMEQG